MSTDLPDNLSIVPRRRRWLYGIAYGGVFVAFSLVLDLPGIYNYLSLVFGLLLIGGSAAMMAPRAFALRLRRDGFDYWAAYRKTSIEWDQVHFIRPFHPIGKAPRVGWNYRSQDDDDEEVLFAGTPSVEGWLPIDYMIPADELATLMSRFRERASPP